MQQGSLEAMIMAIPDNNKLPGRGHDVTEGGMPRCNDIIMERIPISCVINRRDGSQGYPAGLCRKDYA